MEKYPRFKAEDLRCFVQEALVRCDIPSDDAVIAADVLVDTDLRGNDSHGVAHLGTHYAYVKGLRNGLVNPRPQCRTVQESPTTALVDGDRGFGPVVAYRAMELAIRKAELEGIGMVTVTNGRHFGAAGYYSMMALSSDSIGLTMTNSAALVLPTYGREPRVGTNAISFAVPAGEEPPYILDIATSTVAVGKLEIARRKGEPIPVGWAVDKDRCPTTDPNEYWRGGALLPLGTSAQLSSHKGYGLAVLVDILAGVLSGVGFGAVLSREDGIVGHFFGAIDISRFRLVNEFKAMMDDMIRTLRSTAPAPGEERVLVPGQKEHEAFQDRSLLGIPLHAEVVGSLKEVARDLGIDFPAQHYPPGDDGI